MSVLIGHASIDENKKIAGGVAGNQTGKELCVRSWYAKGWDYVLRCTVAEKAEIMATACEKACNNKNIGYDQNERNSLRKQAQLCGYDLSKITTPCECDCSSLMAVCAECAGIPILYSGNNAPTTRTMRSAFVASGMFVVLTTNNYLSNSNYLKRGDILVKAGSHTVMVLTDGATAEHQAPAYEKGKTYTTKANLYIRQTPYGNKIKHSSISRETQIHSHFDAYGDAILDRGTKVTCYGVSKLTDSTWLQFSSGWICAINKGDKYIE